MTDYTDPSTIDVDEVIANINLSYRIRGHIWTDRPTWPNVTVKALADEILRLRGDGSGPPDFVQRSTPDANLPRLTPEHRTGQDHG